MSTILGPDPTVEELIDRLRHLSVPCVGTAGRQIRDEHRSAADEIEWWSATIQVERLLRRHHQRHAASSAAAAASRAVREAAVRAHLPADSPDVIATARAAADAAGALIAGAEAAVDYFLNRLRPCLEAVPVAA